VGFGRDQFRGIGPALAQPAALTTRQPEVSVLLRAANQIRSAPARTPARAPRLGARKVPGRQWPAPHRVSTTVITSV